MASVPDWSSLPPELINCIAGCFLATNDVDHYMDFRAVCSSWRSTTDDPKNSSDIRFRPLLWVIIDEVYQSDVRLLVNIATGRAARKDLPLLRNCYIIATTHGGFFVLADRKSPHAACVLNPFTGHMIRFMAPVPLEMDATAAVSGSSPTLFFFTIERPIISMADPHGEYFSALKENDMYHFIRLAVQGGICTDGEQGSMMPLSFPVAKISEVMKLYNVDPSMMDSDDDNEPSTEFYILPRHVKRCFLVKSAGEVLIIFKMKHHMEVFKMDPDRDVAEPVKSIGNQAIFVGYRRCLSVRADKFPSINADCIYYVKCGPGSSMDIYMYDLKDKKEERIPAAIDSLNPITLSVADPPFTVIQLLSSCTINVRESQLFENWFRRWEVDVIPFDDEFASDFELGDIDMYD